MNLFFVFYLLFFTWSYSAGVPETVFCQSSEEPTLLTDAETIISPGYDQNKPYNSNMNCFISRYSNTTHNIKIIFDEIDLESTFDYLEIYKVYNKSLIGGKLPVEQLSKMPLTGKEMILDQDYVTFLLKSDGSDFGRGLNMTIMPFDINECADPKLHKCSAKSHCHDLIGGYKCVCMEGYTGSGTECHDIDECQNPDACTENSDCFNEDGHYRCVCRSGFKSIFKSNQKVCEDINECELNNKICSSDAKCINLVGGYKCVCNDGYYGNGRACNDIDECISGSNNCSQEARCSNTHGSYSCECLTGHKGDGFTCEEMFECSTGDNNCSPHATCTDIKFGYTCVCLPGYTGDGWICNDINECHSQVDNCSTNANCKNTFGGFNCECKYGFEGDGFVCKDVDECEDIKNKCAVNGHCENTLGGYRCVCDNGYEGDGINHCTDIDECSNPFSCRDNADCHNTIGSFRCTCHDGYEGPPCTDINECKLQTHKCSKHASCLNGPGGYKCECSKGYSGDGFNCTDIDECANNPCHKFAHCTNIPGNFTCECWNGTKGNGTFCRDIDECVTGHQCSSLASCFNTIGSYNCTCNLGYEGDGLTCEDTNECKMGLHYCSSNADCTNKVGSFSCSCKDGFIGNGHICKDINECKTDNLCSKLANCTNNEGSYTCKCKEGYKGNGFKCKDIDECNEKIDKCHKNADCINNEGSYKCACAYGYAGNGFFCEDINECINNNHTCSPLARCINHHGNHTCECKEGYTGDGSTCQDIDECQNENTDCQNFAHCINSQGSYNCECNDGYKLEGQSCIDINECQVDSICDENAVCRNLPGSFQCDCKTGYLKSGLKCLDIDECEKGTFTCTDRTKCVNTDGSYNCKCKENYYENGLSCEAYCEKLEYKGFTFNKTNESTLSVSNEKCEKTGKAKAQILCKLNKKPIDEPASFDISTFQQFQCSSEIINEGMVKKALDEISSKDDNHFDETYNAVELLKKDLLHANLNDLKEVTIKFDDYYVKVVEPPKNKTNFVIHTARENKEGNVDVIDVTIPIKELNLIPSTTAAVVVHKNSNRFFNSPLDSRLVSVLIENQNNDLKLKNPVSLSYQPQFEKFTGHNDYGIQKQIVCFSWDKASYEFSSKDCCLDDTNPEKPVCSCYKLSNYALVLTNNNERIKPLYSTPVLVSCILSMVGFTITMLILCCSRKPTHLTESFKCINFALVTTIFFAVILVIDITVKTPKYCHIIAIIQHFLGLSAWFWLASIAKGIYDNSEKENEFWETSGSIILSIIINYGAAALVVGATAGLTLGYFDKVSKPLSSTLRCKATPSYYYSPATCWLHEYAFLGGFLFFAGVITIFIIAISLVLFRISSNNSHKEIANANKRHLVTFAMFTLIHSISWASMIASWEATNSYYQICMWIFVGFNSLQGFFFLYVSCFEKVSRRKLIFNIKSKKEVGTVFEIGRENYNYTSKV